MKYNFQFSTVAKFAIIQNELVCAYFATTIQHWAIKGKTQMQRER